MVSFEDNKIKITGEAPLIICARCGKIFVSRGKRDEFAINNEIPAYCDECEKDMEGYYFGGPLDGQPIQDKKNREDT